MGHRPKRAKPLVPGLAVEVAVVNLLDDHCQPEQSKYPVEAKGPSPASTQ
ncbi:MAG: hypothetical protein HW392_1288 [Steroidobacteraceae bacterium]|nr:hypothetical protein [Steroidobacteraceae bacterium]